MQKRQLDVRADRTQRALLGAFSSLIQTNRYESLTVSDITTLADVSRSTFYAHFSSKDSLLARSIAGPFSVLADTVKPDADMSRLLRLLNHFWENRSLCRAVLDGAVRRKTVDVLVMQIEDRLRSAGLKRRGVLLLPGRLAAIQLAEMLLAPVTAWLLGESRCSAEALACALPRTCIGALTAMRAN